MHQPIDTKRPAGITFLPGAIGGTTTWRWLDAIASEFTGTFVGYATDWPANAKVNAGVSRKYYGAFGPSLIKRSSCSR